MGRFTVSKKTTKLDKSLILMYLSMYAGTLLLVGLFKRYVMKDSLGEVLGSFILTSAILLLAFLTIRYKSVGRIIDRAFTAYFLFFGWMFITLGNITLFYWLLPFIYKLRLWFQIVAFVMWGFLLAAAVFSVATEKNRERVLKRLRKFSLFAPIAYSFNLLMISILFFSSVTYVLTDHGVLKLNGPTGTQGAQISPEVIRDFYSWHFLQGVPLLKVNETLHWKEPLTYESGWVGLILLLFQLTVIVPVIAAFAWRVKKEPSRKPPRRTARISNLPYYQQGKLKRRT
jgi:Ca2+/Na+ antiporter